MKLAERSLSDFIQQAWPVIEPGTEYLHNWHVDAICEYLQAVDAGQVTRLLINMPPRYMKSIAVSVMWPAWSWINNPESRWLFASYAGNLSTQHSVDRRTIIQSDWYQERWANKYQLTSDQNVKTEYQNDRQGRMFATSFGGVATGKGGDRIVIDDPHDPKGAESDVQRDSTVATFKRKLSTRLNDKKKGAIVVVMQRLHEKDVSATCIEEGYTHLCLPCEDSPDKVISTPSGKEFTRDVSGILWPEREGPREIAQAKIQLGPYGYAGQYQQRPAPAGGGRFKRDWFRYYKTDGEFYKLLRRDGSFKVVRISDCDRFATMDPAGTEKERDNKPCYTVIGVWDVTPNHEMIKVEHVREMMETPEVVDKGIEIVRRFDCPWLGVEKDGIGLGVVQNIRRRGVTVRAIKAKGSKQARSETAEIRMAAGMIFFPVSAPWLFDLETELMSFPKGEYVDQVDELAHAALWVHRQHGAVMTPDDEQHSESVTEKIVEEEAETRQADRMSEYAELQEAMMWGEE